MSAALIEADDLAQASARRATADIAAQFAWRIVNGLLGVAVTIVLVRHLGDRDFGRWTTILAVVSLVAYFADMRLEQVAVERAASEPALESRWLSALLSLRLALALAFTGVSVLATSLVASTPPMRAAGLILSATLLVAALASARAVFQLRVRNSVNAAIEFANGVLWGAAVFAIAMFGGGLETVAAAFLATLALTSLGQTALALRQFTPRLAGSRADWTALLRVGALGGVAGLLILAYGRIDQVLVFNIAGARSAGLYGAVYRVLDRAQLIPATVMLTLFPVLTAAYRTDRERARRLFQTALETLVLLTAPLVAVTAVTSGLLVRAAFGARFAEAAPALPILMAAFVVISIGYLTGYMVVVLRRQARLAVYALAGLILNVGANLALIGPYGFVAAAWTTLATEVLVVGLSLHLVLSELGMPVRPGRLLRAVSAAALTGLCLWGLRGAHVSLGVMLACATPLYGALAMGAGALDLAELRRLRA